MDISGTVAQIAELPIMDRIKIVQAILDTIADEEQPPLAELTDEQKRVFDRRLAELDANPNNVLTWDQIKAHVRTS